MKEEREVRERKEIERVKEGIIESRVAGSIFYWDTPSHDIEVGKVEDCMKMVGLRIPFSVSEKWIIDKSLADVCKEIDVVWRHQKKGGKRVIHIGKVAIADRMKVDTGKVVISDGIKDFELSDDVKEKFLEKYSYWTDNVLPSKVSAGVVFYIMNVCHGLRLRRLGGFYFVKSDYDEKLIKLEKFLKHIGFKVYRLKVMDSESLRSAVFDSFVDVVNSFVDDVKRWCNQKRKTVKKAKKWIEELRGLKGKIERYKLFIETGYKTLDDLLNNVERMIKDALPDFMYELMTVESGVGNV